MRKIICELCGSNQLIKKEGVYVCEFCRTKYSPEEAKKMMIDGIVEVSGTVKMDSSDKLNNLYQIARRSKNDNNAENAAKYYDMILIEDPTSWEATFYVVYFKAMGCKIAHIQSAAISVNNCLDSVLGLIKDTITNEVEQEAAVNEVAIRVADISNMLSSAAKNHYENIDYQIQGNYNQEYVNNVFASINTLYSFGNLLESLFEDKKYACDLAIIAWKAGIDWHNELMKLFVDKEANKNQIMIYVDKIKKYDTSYQSPNISTSSGCYIATAIYGSYNCPQVLILRNYRDMFLSRTWYGRVFISLYYAVSPKVVRLFGKMKWFNTIFKIMLDKIIEKLKKYKCLIE